MFLSAIIGICLVFYLGYPFYIMATSPIISGKTSKHSTLKYYEKIKNGKYIGYNKTMIAFEELRAKLPILTEIDNTKTRIFYMLIIIFLLFTFQIFWPIYSLIGHIKYHD